MIGHVISCELEEGGKGKDNECNDIIDDTEDKHFTHDKHFIHFTSLTAASRLAGESSFGSESIDMTEIMIASTPRIGLHRISDVSL